MTSNSSKKTILVIDSDPTARATVRECLEKAQIDAEVLESDDAADVNSKLATTRMDLVILDINLPKANGVGLLRSLPAMSALRRPGHIIVLSSFLAPEASKHSSAAITYLSKPVPAPALTAILSQRFGTPNGKAASAPQIDSRLFGYFHEGMRLVFSVTGGMQIRKARSYLRRNEKLTGDAATILKLRSKPFDGWMRIVLDKKAYDALIQIFMDKHPGVTPQEAATVLPEIGNQVFGYAKRELNNLGHSFALALPESVTGSQCVFGPPGPQEVSAITTFESQHGEILLEIRIEKVPGTG